ncbi:mycofactocin-coupled SDR family oxidoreductase [Sporichthya brevicatena]|uniref:Mycofactocin-coupled SDR family oxidoreductase n=1 Tax=Sporichthya brevicatena TaxID=171442 RepID=A0ABN1G3S9_9ACTN
MARPRLKNKVAFISGIARGQGRSHAIRLAEEGADIIGFDICAQLESCAYPLATPEDLEQTIKAVEALDRRIVAEQADVRDTVAVQRVLARGLAEFGHVDIVLANAGIATMVGEHADDDMAWLDSIDVMLTGVYNTCRAAIPHMIERGQGGAIVITSSTAGLKGMGTGTAGSLGYTASKHGVVGLMKALAIDLAPHFIRVNTVHPTGVNTPMVANEAFLNFVMEHPKEAEGMQNLIPVAMVEPEDISNAIAWLVSDEAQYVTGITMPVDAGFTIR